MERDHVLHPALRPYVASLVGYRARLDPRAVHHGLPSPTITVVLSFDEPLDAGWLGRPAGRGGADPRAVDERLEETWS